MSDFLFAPNEFGSKLLFREAKRIHNNKDEIENLIVLTVISLIIYYIIMKLIDYIKNPYFFHIFIFPLLVLWGIFNYVNPYDVLNKTPRSSLVINFVISFSLLLLILFKIQYFNKYSDNSTSVDDIKNLTRKVFTTIGVIILIFVIILAILLSFSKMPGLLKTFQYIIFFILIVGAGGIAYLYLKKKQDEKKNVAYSDLSLFEKIIYYIPCLLIDFIDYVKEQYKITTKTIWILFALEIIFISLYFIIPIIFKYLMTKDAVSLLDDPVYLNNKHTLGTFENLVPSSNMKGKYKYKYAISGWFYINPQPPSTNSSYTKYTTIFDYAKKPIIEYNGLQNKIRIKTDVGKNKHKILYITENISYQKWNNFVINYDGANMDIFMNGELVGTIENVAPYMHNDWVYSGSMKGIHGGICNVKYYNETLSYGTIKNNYNILKTYNTPVI